MNQKIMRKDFGHIDGDGGDDDDDDNHDDNGTDDKDILLIVLGFVKLPL